MSLPMPSLTATTLIPDLLRAAPQVRPVLDRYGLRGCGGPLGPHESLAFFAKAHEVPVERLLGELRTSLADKAAGSSLAPPNLADAIYRPFFKAGIAVVLTAGGAWGAFLLLRIALAGRFAAASLHEVNAHGHAQIFGWVGLFVMGFAYQAFPRFKHGELAHPRLANASLWLLLAGLTVRSVAEPLAGALSWLGPVAVAASALELAAIGLFVYVIAATWRACGKGLALYDYYIGSALFWFVFQASFEMVYLGATLAAPNHDALINLAATWQGALREIQIHGFALLMILGASQRIFPNFYGLATPSPRLARAALFVLNAAVVGEAAGLILLRQGGPAWAALWLGSVLTLATTVLLLVKNWGIFGPAQASDRSLKFLRAAYVWLLLSLALLLLLPAYQYGLLPLAAPTGQATRIGFSHAYYGAVRHAVTVGFVSLMIMGVAAKVVPTLNGVDIHGLSPMWGPFVLINLGCGLRVVFQILTDLAPAVAFPVAGVSGLLEVTALAWWGAHLWAIMAGRSPMRQPAVGASGRRLAAGEIIVASSIVGEILDRYPELLPTFLAFGFRPLASPWMRRAMAGRVTVSTACRFLGVDPGELLEALNRQRRRKLGDSLALPMVSDN
jgi:hypothetical protein